MTIKRVLLVGGCALGVCAAAIVQTMLVQGLAPRPQFFVIPMLVGAFFGLLISWILEVRQRERAVLEELEQRDLQISRLNEALERKVHRQHDRIRDTEEQLLQTQKMEALALVTSGVAHDFNNLLGAVRGLAEVILLEELSPHQRVNMEEVVRVCDRAARLVRRLLALGRGSGARGTPQVVDLSSLLEEMRPLLKAALGSGCDTAISCTKGAYVMVDPSELEQALMNLVLNARDAMRDTTRRLRMSVERTESSALRPMDLPSDSDVPSPNGPFWAIHVEDNGTGITSEHLQRIFEPFFSTKSAERGSGMGLPVVRTVVERAGGAVGVESEVGRGSRFSLYLPAASLDELDTGKISVPTATDSSRSLARDETSVAA